MNVWVRNDNIRNNIRNRELEADIIEIEINWLMYGHSAHMGERHERSWNELHSAIDLKTTAKIKYDIYVIKLRFKLIEFIS